jgi:hypothetical protein
MPLKPVMTKLERASGTLSHFVLHPGAYPATSERVSTDDFVVLLQAAAILARATSREPNRVLKLSEER